MLGDFAVNQNIGNGEGHTKIGILLGICYKRPSLHLMTIILSLSPYSPVSIISVETFWV